METDSTDAAWAAARAAVPDAMSRDEIAVLLGEVRRARAWLDGIEMRAARRVRQLESIGSAEPADSLLANAGGHCGRDAHTITERDELCEQMPAVEDAFTDGDLPAGYVDAIASAARGLPDTVRAEYTTMADELLGRARQLSLDAFRRECRDLAKHLLTRAQATDDIDQLTAQRAASNVTRWIDHTTGMHHTHLELDPVRDAKLAATANAELARLRAANTSTTLEWTQLQLDAFINAITGITTPHTHGDHPEPNTEPDQHQPVDRIPEITALISYDWLIGHTDHGICETDNGTPLPVATMRRLCCDAEIIPIVLGTNSEVLDQGRSARTATRPQRQALRAMHRSCAHPHCNVGFDACRIHHIRWWWHHHGPTNIDNLLPLCEHHHHHVHEGRWNLTMTPDRTATWTRPDGTLFHHGTTIDRRPTPVTARADRSVPTTHEAPSEQTEQLCLT